MALGSSGKKEGSSRKTLEMVSPQSFVGGASTRGLLEVVQ